MYTPDVAALAGVNVPIVPMAHQYLITKPHRRRRPTTCPSSATPTTSCTSGARAAGSCSAATSAIPAPWSVDGVPADFNNQLLPEDWDRFAPLMENAMRRVPAVEHADIVQLVNGPEGFTPDNEFVPRRERGAGLLRRRRVLRARHRGRGRRRPGDGRVDRSTASRVRHVEDGHPPLRRAVPQPRPRAAPASSRCTRPTTTSTTRTRSARPAGRCAAPRRTTRLAELGCAFGEKSGGSGRTGSTPNAARGRRAAAAAWAGRASTGARRSAPRRSRAATRVALFDETSFSKLELAGPGRGRVPRTGSAPTRWTGPSAR